MLRTKDNLHTLIESLANPSKPVTLCSLSAVADSPKFISPTEIGYGIATSNPNANVTAVQRLNLKPGGKPITVATVQGNVLDVAWSPDGSSVAYLAYPDGGNQLWLKAGTAKPKALTPVIPLFGRDVYPDDQTIVRFSYDGKYVLMVDTFVSGAAPTLEKLAEFQVLSAQNGGLIWVPPSALGVSGSKLGPYVTMAAWSQTSDRLYYRDQTGVHTWDAPKTVGTLAAKLVWYSPSMSPDGTLLAYTVNMTTQPRIDIRNVSTGSIKVLAGLKGAPLMLSDSEMIEAHFVKNTQYGPPYIPTGYYILNLLTNKETAIPGILMPLDSWPH
jgi:Tol biopolymer transport system component